MQKLKSKPYTVIDLQEGKKLIYFPFKKTMVEADSRGLEEITRYFNNPNATINNAFVARLSESGLLDVDEKERDRDKGKCQGQGQAYAPTALTLFPTMDCNLRCVYCYSRGGESQAQMDMELAKAAINQIVANALLGKRESISINFHGGGEPTLNWEIVTGAAEYAKALGKALDLCVYISCGTNGNIPEERAPWLITNMDFVCLSLDGIPVIHDAQRPAIDGTSSFANAFKTLRLFEDTGFKYKIRTTVSRKSLAFLPEFLEFLKRNAPHAANLQIEPLSQVGRALQTSAEPPSAGEFADAMGTLTQIGEKLSYPVSFASCDLSSVRNEYCGAYGRNFVVTPLGHVTSCYEISTPDDPRWEYFHIGNYDREQQKFVMDYHAISKLERLSEEYLASCGDCIGRFHCAGDCPAKRLFNDSQKNDRCSVIKKLTKDQIVRKAKLLDSTQKAIYL